jgi:NADH:ubiquinone oxidoreductase subunit E
MASTPAAVCSTQKFEKLPGILDLHARRSAGLIPILQAIQHEYNYLPEEVLTCKPLERELPMIEAAKSLPAQLFHSNPANGKSTLSQMRRVIICAGTGCMANGTMKVFEQFQQQNPRLGPEPDSGTSPRSLRARYWTLQERLPGLLPDRTPGHGFARQHSLYQGPERGRSIRSTGGSKG